MMSYSTIQELAQEAADAARAEGKEPLPVDQAIAAYKATGRFTGLPFLGNYVPEGWQRCEQIEPLFVDASGRGSEREPALTIPAFLKVLGKYAKARDHYAVGIIEAGEMQVYVALYRPDSRDFTHTGKLTGDDLRRVRSK